jgi:hypothetical protein
MSAGCVLVAMGYVRCAGDRERIFKSEDQLNSVERKDD